MSSGPSAGPGELLQELFTQLEVQSGGGLQLVSSACGGRSLFAAKNIADGEPILALPLCKARTSNRALAQLRSSEAALQGAAGLLQGGIDAALDRCSGLLPGQMAHVLLLALGLLTDLRSRGRAAQADMRLLPTPPGSPLAALCTAGTPEIDLQLFSAIELAELQCAPLAVATIREQHRLAALHTLLFSVGGRPQPLSLQSFVWAHCLVRSRALSLHLPAAGGSEGGAGSRGASPPGQLDMCMLPGVDLCNHPTEGPASCAVHLRLSRTRTSVVELLAARDLAAGDEVLLNYGDRPLRDFLCGYAFLPHILPHEIYEDLGAAHQALLVSGAASSSGELPPMFLQEVVVLSNPGEHPLLYYSAATLLYIIGSSYEQYGVRLSIKSHSAVPGASLADSVDAAGDRTADSDIGRSMTQEDLPELPAVWWLTCQQEASICGHLVKETQELLLRMGSSVESDERKLSSLDASPVSSAGNPRIWVAHQHLRLAVQYRLARKRLLMCIMDGLDSQQQILSSDQDEP